MNIKKQMIKFENNISKYACKDSDCVRFNPIEEDIRPPFFRDIDRIIYSLAYERYIDKTQVFSNINNDNISKRVIHVQLVSKIARTIGRALNLNEDLIEAASLGHDLGHVPFGHVGESILNKISLANGEGYFYHNVQSVRTLMFVEDDGKGKNISLQVLDAILCHNGEIANQCYQPKPKTKEKFLEDYYSCYNSSNPNSILIPMTLEGCVVRISDIVGYIGRDIEDAIRLGVIKKEDLPKNIVNVLGDNNRDIVNTIIMDIIENSYNKPYIKISDNVYNALVELKEYNTKNIYLKANSKEQISTYEKMFNELFNYYCNVIKSEDKESDIYKVFLNDMNDDYLKNETVNRKVIDYIAGMTDNYFLRQYENHCNMGKKEDEH